MKVLFFTMSMMQGGAERVISTLCSGKLGKGNCIHILTVLDNKAEFDVPHNVKCYGMIDDSEYFGKGKLKTLSIVCRKYHSFVKQVQPDIIIAFLPEPCFIAGVYRRVLKIPVIGSERGNPYFQFRNPVYKALGNLLYAKADGFVFQTEDARDFFMPKVQKKSIIIGNPIEHIDLPIIPMNQRKKEIVAVGRFTVEKNYPLLVSAFERVIQRHPGFKLRIYGRYSENDDTVKMIKERGLSEYIVLEGSVDNVREKINDAYAFVLTSFTEGLPNALMEAMSVGLPVIATDCPSGGPRLLIQDGVNGLLVRNRDEDGIVNALCKLIDRPEIANSLGKTARKIAEEYSEERISNIWINYIEAIRSCEKYERRI